MDGLGSWKRRCSVTLVSIAALLGVLVSSPGPAWSGGRDYRFYQCADADNWRLVDKAFYSTERRYVLQGEWIQTYICQDTAMHSSPCYTTFRFEILGVYRPLEKTFTESSKIYEYTGQSQWAQYLLSVEGESVLDPWLTTAPAGYPPTVTGVNAKQGEVWPEGVPPRGGVWPYGPPQIAPLSFCAIPAGERQQLLAQTANAPPPPCRVALHAPEIVTPGERTYDGNVTINLRVNCSVDFSLGNYGPWFDLEILREDRDGAYARVIPEASGPGYEHVAMEESPAPRYLQYTTGKYHATLPGRGRYRMRTRAVQLVSPNPRENLPPSAQTQETSHWVEKEFFVGKTDAEIFSEAKERLEPAPDLVVDAFEVTGVPAGAPDLAGGTAAFRRLYFTWTVHNRGDETSGASRFTVVCTRVGGGECPPELTYSRVLPPLLTNGEGGAGYAVWNEPPIPAPPTGETYRFLAIADAGHHVREGENDDNNQMTAEYTQTMRSSRSFASLREIASRQEGGFGPAPPTAGAAAEGRIGKAVPGAAVATAAGGGKPILLPPPGAGALKVKPPVVALAPVVSVRKLALTPAQPKAGELFRLSLEFDNTGSGALAPAAEYAIACTVVSGPGPCPVPAGARRYGAPIAPGASLVVGLPMAGAPAGAYRLEVTPLPERAGSRKTLDFKVAPKLLPGADDLRKKTPALHLKPPKK